MSRARQLSFVALLACTQGAEVGYDAPFVPPPETCNEPDVDAPNTFVTCSVGSGIYGRWVIDAFGMPAYDYGLDENADVRASFYNTENKDRRDHWFSFGNSRVTALAYNDGYVELTMQDRGETYLNKFDDTQSNFAGGFSYIDDGTSSWSTAYKWRPAGAKTTRRFGMNYVQTTIAYHGLDMTRVTYAPDGDVSAIVTDVTLTNTQNTDKTIEHYEYWDVARRPIETNWIVSGNPLTSVPAAAAAKRDSRNGMFSEHAQFDLGSAILSLHRTYTGTDPLPPREQPNAVDYYPADPFLAVLIAPADGIYTHQSAFFGAGGVANPDAIAQHSLGESASDDSNGLGQPRMFAVRSHLVIPAGKSQTLRFAYGFADASGVFPVQDEWHDPDCNMLTTARTTLQEHLVYFASRRDGPIGIAAGALQREMAWHSAQIEASVAWREYWGHHVVPQGSAYLYLHGGDGALRDLALFTIPLVYSHPALAREELLLMSGMQFASDQRFSYAFQGHGILDDALGIHAHPSDLDIAYLWALSEYVGPSGDDAFLDAPAPYYPKEAIPDATVFDHVVGAVRHLFDTVGTGAHGLVKVGDGDWDDGIVFQAPNRQLAIDQGESVPNTQMAVAVLPRVADLVEPRDGPLADEIRQHVASYRAALPQTWNGAFFGRAYFGDDTLFQRDTIDLQSQVWALIGDTTASDTDRMTLTMQVGSKLDDPSSMGATLTPSAQVWPAISGLATWGYALHDPERAWNHFARNTLTAHALAFPNLWYGIWSAPDGLNANFGDHAGETYFSAATPMTDFPVLNNNAHAMPLLALMRGCGLEASAYGLVVAPHFTADFSLRTELIDLTQRGSVVRGTYRPAFPGARSLEVRAPPGHVIVSVTQDGQQVAAANTSSVVLSIAPLTASTDFAMQWL